MVFKNELEHEKDNLKQLIINSTFFEVLQPFHGMTGGSLEQKHHEIWHTVCYASRTSASSDENYCQLKK